MKLSMRILLVVVGFFMWSCKTSDSQGPGSEVAATDGAAAEKEQADYIFEIESSAFVKCPASAKSSKDPAVKLEYNGECFIYTFEPGFIKSHEENKDFVIHIVDSYPDISSKGMPSPTPGVDAENAMADAYDLIKKAMKYDATTGGLSLQSEKARRRACKRHGVINGGSANFLKRLGAVFCRIEMYSAYTCKKITDGKLNNIREFYEHCMNGQD